MKMIKEYQQLETQISIILKENYQLKQEVERIKQQLVREEKRPITETRQLLLAIIRELDELERDETHEMSGVSPENRVFGIAQDVYRTAKKPLLKMLKQNKVEEMSAALYESPEYVISLVADTEGEENQQTPRILQKGYLYKGEILRKGKIG